MQLESLTSENLLPVSRNQVDNRELESVNSLDIIKVTIDDNRNNNQFLRK